MILEEDEVILRAFQEFDKADNGYITEDEFRFICTQLGQKLPESIVDEIIAISDLNQNGKINYKDLIDFWHNQKLI